jgi:hypothetical protein
MTAEEFLQQLNPNSRVFDLSIDYKYTEEQLVLFAKLYHESELKKMRVTDVSGRSELLKCGNQNPPCSPNLKYGILECCDCNWSE